jgi:diguanylate cyclase (GGDEF)-like protein/PAS domain S-box-containing protein
LTAAAVAALLSGYAWRRRAIPGAIPVVFLLLSVAVWCLGYAFEIAAPGFPLKLVSAKLQYFGIVGVPAFWLTYTLLFTGNARWLTLRNRLLLAIMPAATLLLAWTNERHGLIWTSIALNTRDPFNDLTIRYGPWFWLNILYSYLLMLAGTVLLIRFFLRSQGIFRRQVGVVLFAAFVPWLGNAAYLAGLNPDPDLDLTPFSFTVTGLLIAWSFYRLQFLDIVPLARHALVESMNESVVVLDARDRVVDINPAARALLRRGPSDLIGQPAAVAFDAYPDMIERFRGSREAHEVVTIDTCGPRMYFDVRTTPLYDRAAAFTGRLIVVQDVTEREGAKLALQKAHDELEDRVQERTNALEAANAQLHREVLARAQAEEALRESEAELRALFAAMTDVVMVLDRHGRWLKVAPTSPSSVFPRGPSESLIGMTLHEVLPAEVADTLLEQIRHALDTRKTVNVEYSLSIDEQVDWFSGVISPIENQQVVLVAHEITDRKNYEDQLVYRTLHDVLTGLPNRKLFMDRLALAFERAKRYPGRTFAVLFLDLDDFKAINDSLGHASGDALLVEVAQRLRHCLRAIDTVARFGGDEFAILVDDVKDTGEAIHVAGRIQQELRDPVQLAGREVPASASIGIAFNGDGHGHPEEVLRDADAAMYRAKAAGGGRHQIFDGECRSRT